MKTQAAARTIRWERSRPLNPEAFSREVWNYRNGPVEDSFDLDVTYGKELDPLSLKRNVIGEFEKNLARIRKESETIFSSGVFEEVAACPVCRQAGESCAPAASFYGGTYVACPSCGHRFVAKRPTQAYLDRFYARDEAYQSTYADPELLEERIRSVVTPKSEWVIKTYAARFGRPPRSLLDVGAGSGHFVAAARRQGLHAEGIELSQSGVDFAKANFDLQLKQTDFLRSDARLGSFDVITFWGVLEHVPQPVAMLDRARERLTDQGMVLAEVPRWFSLSTEIQKAFPDSIIRHCVPNIHIHMFTDASLATAFCISRLKPAAAWYFGMDVYEGVIQVMREGKGNLSDLRRFSDPMSRLQSLCDRNYLSDFLVLAGVPVRNA